mmetsp:Transcript_32983/g.47773  ORF Transcript_32983/g.47773 Transcript_32983/m.47773 type:complete len:81 (+) Transcript_32983:975-1217(+)
MTNLDVMDLAIITRPIYHLQCSLTPENCLASIDSLNSESGVAEGLRDDHHILHPQNPSLPSLPQLVQNHNRLDMNLMCQC